MTYDYNRTASWETRLPAQSTEASVSLPVVFQVYWQKAVVDEASRKRNIHGLTDALVTAPAVVEMFGVKKRFKVTYHTTLIREKVDAGVNFWKTTTLPKFWELIFEMALKASGVERTVGSVLFK